MNIEDDPGRQCWVRIVSTVHYCGSPLGLYCVYSTLLWVASLSSSQEKFESVQSQSSKRTVLPCLMNIQDDPGRASNNAGFVLCPKNCERRQFSSS
jgi:hypothetical protein